MQELKDAKMQRCKCLKKQIIETDRSFGKSFSFRENYFFSKYENFDIVSGIGIGSP